MIFRLGKLLGTKGPRIDFPDPERLDINDVIREVIALSDGELRGNGASLRTEMPGNLPPVVVDRVLLQQVILNLMMNAMEAMRAVSDRARVLRIRTEGQASGSIVVLVQDSGVGIDPEHSSRMFEAFYTTKVEGIGMGLTISRSNSSSTTARCACWSRKRVNSFSSGIISGTRSSSFLIASKLGSGSSNCARMSLMWTRPIVRSKWSAQSGKRVWRAVLAR